MTKDASAFKGNEIYFELEVKISKEREIIRLKKYSENFVCETKYFPKIHQKIFEKTSYLGEYSSKRIF